MDARTTALVLDGFDDRGGLDTAVSRVILERVAGGELPNTFRISRPGRVVAFGKRDRLAEGFRSAVDTARGLRYGAVIRLPGGRAAAFHEGTLSFSWTTRAAPPVRAERERFVALAQLIVDALRLVGVDAAIGAVPGEYCPGEFSVNARGSVKLAGIGQRVVRGAAHVGGMLVVDGADGIREVLVPVYRALGLTWDPATAGAVCDVTPQVDIGSVTDALAASLAARVEVIASALEATTIARARSIAARYTP